MEPSSRSSINIDLSPPELGGLDFQPIINAEWLWLVFGVYALISFIFFITVLYHWLRYETNTLWASVVIATNGLVIVALLGGASVNLRTFLSTVNQAVL